ncbi:MAG: hypothetical protein P8X52_10995, partial [Limibacillus sp.]
NMVKAAVDLTITDLISESGNYDRYALTDDKKIGVQAFSGGKMVRSLIKSDQAGSSSGVRVTSSRA